MPKPRNKAIGQIETSPEACSMIAQLKRRADRLHQWPTRVPSNLVVRAAGVEPAQRLRTEGF